MNKSNSHENFHNFNIGNKLTYSGILVFVMLPQTVFLIWLRRKYICCRENIKFSATKTTVTIALKITVTMLLYPQELTCQSTHALLILNINIINNTLCMSRYFFALLGIFAFLTVNT